MNELQLTYSPYTLQLKQPLKTSKKIITERKGFILKLEDSGGNFGIGDVCPFPEFGTESLNDAEKSMSGIKLKLKIDRENLEESIFDCLKDQSSLPSLRHGLEQAILSLLCRKQQVILPELLGIKLKKNVKVNAVIGFTDAEKSVSAAEEFVKNGYKTLKIKVGREHFEDDFSIIKLIRHKVGSEIKIRIDANGIWNLNDAIANLKRSETLDIEYAEQPVNTIDNYVELKNNCSVPLAADESVRSLKDAKQFIDSKSISHIILKPMMLGGLLPTLEIINYAEENNVTPVVTTSFESAIGKINAVIAAANVKSGIAHGLGTNNLFTENLIEDPYQINSGTITI